MTVTERMWVVDDDGSIVTVSRVDASPTLAVETSTVHLHPDHAIDIAFELIAQAVKCGFTHRHLPAVRTLVQDMREPW